MKASITCVCGVTTALNANGIQQAHDAVIETHLGADTECKHLIGELWLYSTLKPGLVNTTIQIDKTRDQVLARAARLRA